MRFRTALKEPIARVSLFYRVVCFIACCFAHFWLFVIDIFTMSGRIEPYTKHTAMHGHRRTDTVDVYMFEFRTHGNLSSQLTIAFQIELNYIFCTFTGTVLSLARSHVRHTRSSQRHASKRKNKIKSMPLTRDIVRLVWSRFGCHLLQRDAVRQECQYSCSTKLMCPARHLSHWSSAHVHQSHIRRTIDLWWWLPANLFNSQWHQPADENWELKMGIPVDGNSSSSIKEVEFKYRCIFKFRQSASAPSHGSKINCPLFSVVLIY